MCGRSFLSLRFGTINGDVLNKVVFFISRRTLTLISFGNHVNFMFEELIWEISRPLYL